MQTRLAMDLFGTLFEKYGLLLAFAAVLLEQLGPPLPSGPLLMVAGALATEGRVSAWSLAGVAWGASMLGKIALYVVGRRYGRQAMGALCRLAVTPNSKIEKTDRRFERWGGLLLIFAEFIPGVLWTGLYLGIGLVFSEQIDEVLVLVERSGKVAVVAIVVAIAYFAVRWWRRRRSLKASG